MTLHRAFGISINVIVCFPHFGTGGTSNTCSQKLLTISPCTSAFYQFVKWEQLCGCRTRPSQEEEGEVGGRGGRKVPRPQTRGPCETSMSDESVI